MCTANLRTKTYERKQCVISSQKKKKKNSVLYKNRERASFPHVGRLHSQTS